MTRKSTIGAAAALTALALAAGSAAAHAAVAHARVAQSHIVFQDVHPDTTGAGDARIDLATSDSNPTSLGGLTLVGCVGADDNEPIEFVTFASTDVIPGNDFLRIIGPGYTGPPHTSSVVADGLTQLNSNDYDLRLDGIDGVVAHATNGNPDPDCVDSLPPITPIHNRT